SHVDKQLDSVGFKSRNEILNLARRVGNRPNSHVNKKWRFTFAIASDRSHCRGGLPSPYYERRERSQHQTGRRANLVPARQVSEAALVRAERWTCRSSPGRPGRI